MKYDTQEVKRVAASRWVDILTSVGISTDTLDGRHHPCPKCGGTDRFRLLDRDAGAVHCNACFKVNNGDGLAAVMWFTGWPFPKALELVAEQVGIKPAANGKPQVDPLSRLAQLKSVSAESLTAYGANVDGKRVTFPVYGGDGEKISEFYFEPGGGVKAEKGLFPSKKNGGKHGMFLPHVDGKVRLPQAGETWLLQEGVKDPAAMHGLGYLAAGMPTNSLSPKFVRLFRGVNVIFVPHRDDAGKLGAEQSAGRLHGTAASVKLAALPAEHKASGGMDARDVLKMNDGEALVRSAIADAKLWEPAKEDKTEESGAIVRRLAEEICKVEYFAQDLGKKLYVYRGGVYKPRGEEVVRRKVKSLTQKWQQDEEWSSHLANEVAEYIRVDASELWERPPLDLLNVQNGLLRIEDKKLLSHTPEHLTTVQLPVDFDPVATCPEIDNFIQQIFPEDAFSLAFEIPAYLMLPDTSIQKAVLLLGAGGNGKSTYLQMLLAFLGKGNTSGVALHQLEADKFKASRLYGKLANICADLPSEHLVSTSVFKQITGGDVIQGEYKFKDSFDFYPFARLVFSANTAPRSKDASEGFFDRWQVIPFIRSFRGTSEEIPRDVLDARLSSPTELSGLLNKALAALPVIKSQKGFSQPKSVQDAWQEFRATTDPLAVWLDRFTVSDPSCVVTRDSLRVAFNAYLERQGRPSLTQNDFGRAFNKLRPEIISKQRTVSHRLQWCYIGMGMVTPEESTSQTSQDSQENLLFKSSHAHTRTHAHARGQEQEGENPVNAVNPVNPDEEQQTWEY